MSQSDAHRRLVVAAAQAIHQRHPAMHLTTDIIDEPGDPVPPLIGGHRPDIVARCAATCVHCIIAEAKTDGDLDNEHTRSQIHAFVDHLGSMTIGTGTFILAVSGRAAYPASTLLRFAFRRRVSDRLHIQLFDGLDFWILGTLGATPWRLS